MADCSFSMLSFPVWSILGTAAVCLGGFLLWDISGTRRLSRELAARRRIEDRLFAEENPELFARIEARRRRVDALVAAELAQPAGWRKGTE
jgi:hypothetical protein